jgi:hypothetical protein
MAELLKFGGYPANDPRNNIGRGAVRNIITNVANMAADSATPITSLDTERNIIPERPFVNRSKTTPETQVFGAIKDRVHNFFQPGDPAYNYDSLDISAPVKQNQPPPAPTVVPSITTSAKPGKITTSVVPPATATVRRAPARRLNTGSQPTEISQPDEEGLRDQSITSSAPQLPAGQRIFEMSGPDSAGMAKAEIASNGGFGTNGNQTFILPSRGTDEEVAFKTQQAQAAQPITALTQPAQQTSTVGYGHGVYELAPGQNAPPDFNAMSLGDMASHKFGVNQQVKQAGITNINSEMARRAAQTQLETNIQPSQINQNNASARHANVAADLGIFKAPAEVDNIKAVTAQHTALANETNALLDLKGKNMISEIDYRKGMLDIGNKKLGLLTKQYDARIAQMKQSKDVPDYKLIADIAKNKAKTYQEISALGALTPEQKLDMQKQNDILDLIQRHATKSSAQYAGTATAITDDEN